MAWVTSPFSSRERPLHVVPRAVVVLLLSALLLQVAWHAIQPPAVARAQALPSPPPQQLLDLAALGEPETLSRLLMLWLQAFDHQPGLSIPYRELDYDRVIDWLDQIVRLDPRAQYPLLTASRVYSEVPDAGRKRKMLEFVEAEFLLDPDRRWPWMAQAVYVAKHRLNDLDLALRYARVLREHSKPGITPGWARQMELFILEDMGELEAAKVLLGGLIESGVVKDHNELKFFEDRLSRLNGNQ